MVLYHRADASGREPLERLTWMLEDYWDDVLRWHHSHRSNRNLIAMLYRVSGKLNAVPVTK